MALVKGSSNSHSLDQMAKIVHLACFAIRTVPYFEYIESKANWADEVSREGTRGTWAPRNAFPVKKCGVLASSQKGVTSEIMHRCCEGNES